MNNRFPSHVIAFSPGMEEPFPAQQQGKHTLTTAAFSSFTVTSLATWSATYYEMRLCETPQVVIPGVGFRNFTSQ